MILLFEMGLQQEAIQNLTTPLKYGLMAMLGIITIGKMITIVFQYQISSTPEIKNDFSFSNQLPEWPYFQKAIVNINSSLSNWDKVNLEAEHTNILKINKYNIKIYKEIAVYLNEFGVSKDISYIFLQNEELLKRIATDIERQPSGKSKVLLHLHIKMAEELKAINIQLESAMEKHIKVLQEDYLIEEKISRIDTQKIIESRTNSEEKNTNYKPFFNEESK
ncbi:hypothetical protein ACQKNX_22810 [Lysinibacillus sp. NPDC093712]|uniref:hypothetical protein n=1 Tax=Lysinibacillus sp. NPDC093712 TaxID=3390579 RepID=UPI003CFEF6E2